MAAKMPGLSQTIKLEGEAEYRAKLKEIGAGLRVLDSEMDKTRASFEGQEKSVEALSATQDVLSRKLSTQHERVETLRAALQQSAQTYGEADARTMSWQTQLNKAEAEETRLQHAIEDCSNAIREQSSAFDSQYQDKLSAVSANLSLLDSELEKTAAAFGRSGDSIEALSARSDILTRKLEEQHKAVEILRAEVDRSVEVYGAADARTVALQTQLNKAEAAESRLKTQIDDCNGALQRQSGDMEDVGEKTDETTGKMSGLGDAVGDAASKLGLNLPQGATNALNGLGSVSAGASAALAGFAALAAGVAKVEKALLDMTKQAAASADELETLSLKTGLTTQTLQELEYAAEFIDVDLNTITGSLAKLTRSMDSAREGTGAAAESFAKLGISVTNSDGSLRSAETVFYETVDALGEIQSATERDALAMDLFGRSAQDLNPLIAKGSGALKDLAKEANATGYVLDEFAVNKLTAVDDAFARLELSRETFTKNLAVEFAPATQKAVGGLADLVDRLGVAIKNSGAVDAFASILESVTSIITPIDQIQDKLRPLKVLLDSIAFLCAWIADTINAIRGLWIGNWGTGMLSSALGMNIYNPSNIQRWENSTNFGLTWNSSALHWEDSSGGVYYATKTGPSAVGSPSFKSTQEQYGDWIAAGGADGNGNGSYEWWYNYVYGHNAAGTDNWRGGLTWVGENGPELALLPRGTQITSASESREVGGDTFNIYVDARNIRELNDLVRIAQTARMNARKAVS